MLRYTKNLLIKTNLHFSGAAKLEELNELSKNVKIGLFIGTKCRSKTLKNACSFIMDKLTKQVF